MSHTFPKVESKLRWSAEAHCEDAGHWASTPRDGRAEKKDIRVVACCTFVGPVEVSSSSIALHRPLALGDSVFLNHWVESVPVATVVFSIRRALHAVGLLRIFVSM